MADAPLLSPGSDDVKDETGGGLEVLPDLLVRPLEDDHEWRHVLHADLVERLLRPPEVRQTGDSAEDAADWVAKRPRASGLLRMRNLVWLAVVAALLCFGAVGLQCWKMLPFLASSTRIPLLQEMALRQAYDLPPAEAPYDSLIDRHRVLGLYSWSSSQEARRGWRAHPDSPLLFYAYAMVFLEESGDLPPDYEEAWRRIDPDNGYWPTLEAMVLTTGTGPGTIPFRAKVTRSSAISDQEIKDLLDEAATKPRWESYRQAYQAYEAAHRRPSRSFPVVQNRRFSLEFDGCGLGGSHWQDLADDARASGTVKPSLLEEIQRETEEIERWQQEREDRFDRVIKSKSHPEVLAGLHFITQFFATLAALLLMGCALLAALRLLPWKGRPGRLAACLAPLLHPRDLVTVMLWGLTGPAAVAVWLSFQTYDRDLEQKTACFMAAAAVGTLVSMIHGARSAVSRRLAFLGMGSSKAARWTSVAAVAAFWTATGIGIYCLGAAIDTRSFDDMEPGFAVAGALAAFTIVWIPLKVLLGYTSPDGNVRHRLVALRLLPALLIMAIAFCVLAAAVYPLELRELRMLP